MMFAEENHEDFVWNGIKIRCLTGSVDFNDKLVITYRNDKGGITDKKPKVHYVCCGVDYCYECGRKMARP